MSETNGSCCVDSDALCGGAADSIRCACSNSFGWFSVLHDTQESERAAFPFPIHWAPSSRGYLRLEASKRGTDTSCRPSLQPGEGVVLYLGHDEESGNVFVTMYEIGLY